MRMITEPSLLVFCNPQHMPKKPPLDAHHDDDAALFREAIGDVRRIDIADKTVARPRPVADSKMFRRDEAEALRDSRSVSATEAYLHSADELSYRRPEIPEKWFKQLKRGQISIQDELDLHHCRAADAELFLKQFLNQAREEAHYCVRIIHGKGLRSENAPVLKALVDRVLRHRGDVLAFNSATPAQGGTGAVLVLLARQ
jgi:DNA-nicking Smr family endonuclease